MAFGDLIATTVLGGLPTPVGANGAADARAEDAAVNTIVAIAAASTTTPSANASGVISPASAQNPGGAPIVVGTAGNDTIDAGYGGKILFGDAGADTFVFGPNIQLGTPTAQPLTHVADYSFAEGDSFDFSALMAPFRGSNIDDAMLVRAVEDPSGNFATLQVNTSPDAGGHGFGSTLASTVLGPPQLAGIANWVNVAQLDGVHAGDAVNVLVDSHAAIHLAQIHVDLHV